MASSKQRTVPTEPQHLYKLAGLLFLLALALRYFDSLARVLLLIYAAAILAVALNTFVRRIPVKRPWAAGIIAVALLGGLGSALWFGGLTVIRQLQSLAASIPQIREGLAEWGAWLEERLGIDAAPIGARAEALVRGFFENLEGSDILTGTGGVLEWLAIPLLVLFGGLFAVGRPNDRLLLPFLRVIPESRRPAFEQMLERLGERLKGWITGTLVSMTTVGILATIAFYLIGVPYALLFGVINGLGEFVPILGAWVGGVPAVIVAFLDDPVKGLWAAIAIVAIQLLDSQLIMPLVMSKMADVHPFVTLFAIVLFGSLFGFLGVLLAVPLVLFFWTVIETLWVEHALDAGDDYIPPVVTE
ncbi:MAG TPA: AI-2E family transporter [Longimicrobiales bacterium]|nr:AI-2E family transporter [Longimicrobiales bacterium]